MKKHFCDECKKEIKFNYISIKYRSVITENSCDLCIKYFNEYLKKDFKFFNNFTTYKNETT